MKDKEFSPIPFVFIFFLLVFAILCTILYFFGPEPSYENLLRQA